MNQQMRSFGLIKELILSFAIKVRGERKQTQTQTNMNMKNKHDKQNKLKTEKQT